MQTYLIDQKHTHLQMALCCLQLIVTGLSCSVVQLAITIKDKLVQAVNHYLCIVCQFLYNKINVLYQINVSYIIIKDTQGSLIMYFNYTLFKLYVYAKKI